MIISATGHRSSKLNQEYNYKGPCTDYLKDRVRLIFKEKNPKQVISGMAIGFDTIVALVALELNIPVLAAVPFIGQERIWPKPSQDLYNEILNNSLTTINIVSKGGYTKAKFQIRDEFMVDRCNLLIACHNGTTGGTLNTIRYAQKINRDVIYINPNDWKKESDYQIPLF
jgi:predicted Rossmann fold nucleotide-binding protein DprA/Smf involved in DNA uptake